MTGIIIRSKIKDVAGEFNVAAEVFGELDGLAEHFIRQAVRRADGNGRRTLHAKDVFIGPTASKTMIVVRSKVKEFVETHNVAGDFADAVNEKMIALISEGIERAKANGRRTLQARDL